jgi:polar amino acid transport system substrate-binding protein
MRSLSAAIVGAALLLGAGSAVAGPTLDRVMERKLMVNVLVNDYPPFSFINDKSEVDGFDVDVAREVAKRLGVDVRIETPAWEAIVGGNWQGRWDICICSMSPTAERAELLDFVTHYYSSPAVLVVHKDDTRFADHADMEGKRIGVGSGSTYETYLNKQLVIDAPDAQPIVYPFTQLEVVPITSETIAFQDLSLGAGVRLDGIVGNYVTTHERIVAGGPFKIVGEPLYGEPNWVSVDKGDPEWVAKIKDIIAAMKADGTLAAIGQKWVGADISKP